MDKDDEIQKQLNLALYELDVAIDYLVAKSSVNAVINIKMAIINLNKIKKVLKYE